MMKLAAYCVVSHATSSKGCYQIVCQHQIILWKSATMAVLTQLSGTFIVSIATCEPLMTTSFSMNSFLALSSALTAIFRALSMVSGLIAATACYTHSSLAEPLPG